MSFSRFLKHDAEINVDTLGLKVANYRAVTHLSNIYPDRLPKIYRSCPWPVIKGHDLQGGLLCGVVKCYIVQCLVVCCARQRNVIRCSVVECGVL